MTQKQHPLLLDTHESFPRNSKIIHIMYKRGVIESIGSGTLRATPTIIYATY